MYDFDDDDEIDAEVERLFREAPDRNERHRENPVTGSRWVAGLDPIAPQKEAARRALKAQKWFAVYGPSDTQPLPLCHWDREMLKVGGLSHMVAWYARSLENLKYDFVTHPSFYDYACGVLASPRAPDFIKSDVALLNRFPPRILPGLDGSNYWDPPRRTEKR
jgi:hypothetical protein